MVLGFFAFVWVLLEVASMPRCLRMLLFNIIAAWQLLENQALPEINQALPQLSPERKAACRLPGAVPEEDILHRAPDVEHWLLDSWLLLRGDNDPRRMVCCSGRLQSCVQHQPQPQATATTKTTTTRTTTRATVATRTTRTARTTRATIIPGAATTSWPTTTSTSALASTAAARTRTATTTTTAATERQQ